MTVIDSGVGLIPIIYALGGVIAPLIKFTTKRRGIYSVLILIIAVITFTLSIRIFKYVIEGNIVVYPFGGWPPPLGIVYVVDFLNGVYGLIATSVFLLVTVYSIWYFSFVSDPSWLTTLLLLNMAGVTGCIYTGDIFNFFVMLEVLAVSSYGLVAFFKKRKWALEASLSYGFIGALATSFFFFGTVFLYAGLGTLNIADISAKVNNISTDALSVFSGKNFGNIAASLAVSIALMLWALTFEAGIFPNNYWLPSAYTEAPTPASAVFAGIVDKVGTYGVLRMFITMFTSFSPILTVRLLGMLFRDVILYTLSLLGLITSFLGAVIMAIQKDVKRLLSYSTISHIGMIFMAIACLTSNVDQETASIALAGILFHSLTHALGESMLFLGLGALSTIAGSRKLSALSGYGRIYPTISIAIALSALSLLGFAPLGGFFSKYTLFLALVSANLWIYAISLIIISGISAIGYFKIIYTLFVQKPEEKREKMKLSVASFVCIVISVALIIIGIAYAQGYLFDVFLSGSKNTISPTGLKMYINSVDYVSKMLGLGASP